MSLPAVAPSREAVAASVRRAPIVAVVRHRDRAEAARQARAFLASELELVEITFTVPDAPGLVRELLAERGEAGGPPWIGMGTVTTPARAEAAVAAGAEFLVTPNLEAEVAALARRAGLFLVMGALTPSEIVAADRLGADLIKVYPLPPVGGPAYLSIVRQPLGDVAPMLAGGGFGIEEIPAYRAAGAVAFGVGAPLLGADDASTRERVARALELARG
ncbi:MAG TPA: 2-dehydro-3-deoxyphosphogluconate aldolase [Thermoanaerobaculia bacterium]|nr:2-dehydro-3-deoxyphosphogluconate aldolase [Thermoanaerobaculia bacterium]